MKHEQCKNCASSTFRERYERPPGFLGFLFGIFSYNFYERIRCSEICDDISHEDYYLICNIGCGSFKDNRLKKE
jgi:hypothetical protein